MIHSPHRKRFQTLSLNRILIYGILMAGVLIALNACSWFSIQARTFPLMHSVVRRPSVCVVRSLPLIVAFTDSLCKTCVLDSSRR